MSLYTPHNRLQPSLLDRLRDDEPNKTVERPDQQIINLNQLREMILRDLAWLLNCDNFDCVEDLSSFPEAKNSVLNFGIPSFSGKTLSTTGSASLEDDVRNAILVFEPRIIPHSLIIKSVLADSSSPGRKTVAMEIGGAIWAQPFPLEFLLRSEMDLDT